ncbi:MAG: protein kinase [Myxococcota bacterium]|nr:protein kinase [Myxococcota bacterium]
MEPLQDGTLIAEGAFRVRALLGPELGGRGYAGERTSDSRPVHIRELEPALWSTPGAWERLWDEVEVVQALGHKSLLPVLGLFCEGDRVLLVSDVLAGQTLRQIIEKRRAQRQPLSLKGAYNAIANVCNALTYAHGVLSHGALCPEVVEITMGGQVRVAELALGRALPLAALKALSPGAWACVAPERRTGGPPTPAADIYAVGVMLLESLTLRLPEEGLRPSQIAAELPRALDEVIATCLLPDPARRYKSPQDLKQALADAVQGGPKATLSHPIFSLHQPPAVSPSAKVSQQLPAVPPPRTAVTRSAAPKNIVQSLSPPGSAGTPADKTMMPPHVPPAPPAGGPPPQGGSPKTSGPQAQVIDEDQERFLITKEDRMDYGPFPLREVRSQIEKGTIHADHFIHDLETGDRRRVREHALLGEMAKEWSARHAQAAIEMRDQAERARHRASVQRLLSGIFIVVLVVGGGVGAYFKFFYKPEVKTVVIKEHSTDDFWKGVEISMKVDPPQAKKPRGKKRVFRNGKWEEVTHLGDASEEGGDETLTGEQVQAVMSKNFKLLGGCLKEEAQRNPSVRKLDIEFLIKGSGNVSAVKVNGESGSEVASCVFAKMQSVEFPKFNGTKTHAFFSIALK